MNPRGWIVLPLLSTPVFAGAMLAYQFALRTAWVPFDGPRVFLHYRVPGAHAWWLRFAAIDAVWNIAFVAAVVYAPQVARVFGRGFFATVLAVQAIALATLVCAPIPLDSDQYAYAYYGSLVERGLNPYVGYTRPLALTSVESRIATHWHNPPVPDRYGPAWTLGNAAVLFGVMLAPMLLIPSRWAVPVFAGEPRRTISSIFRDRGCGGARDVLLHPSYYRFN